MNDGSWYNPTNDTVNIGAGGEFEDGEIGHRGEGLVGAGGEGSDRRASEGEPIWSVSAEHQLETASTSQPE